MKSIFTLSLILSALAFTQKASASSIENKNCELLSFADSMEVTPLYNELISALEEKGYKVTQRNLSWGEFLLSKHHDEAIEFFKQEDKLYMTQSSGHIFGQNDCAILYGDQVSCSFYSNIENTNGTRVRIIGGRINQTKTFFRDPVRTFYTEVRSQFKNIPKCKIKN